MNNNVVIVLFQVESEAFQAFNELCKAPVGEGYIAPEAALLRNRDGYVEVCDFYGNVPDGSGVAKGIVIGSLVGVLGGPIGVILGADAGAMMGGAKEAGRALDVTSAVAVVASKIFDGETAIAALVGEEEPAFSALFAKYKTATLRYDAADIADEVDRLYELEAEIDAQVRAELKADMRVARKELREERREAIKTQLDTLADDLAYSPESGFSLEGMRPI